MTRHARSAALVALCLSPLVATPALADILDDFDALRAPASAGGSVITTAEVAAFRAGLERYRADDALRGLVHAAVLRADGAFPDDSSYALLQQGLRFRVAGLAMSPQAPGISFERSPLGVIVTLDPHGVAYSDVAIVYTDDGWQTGAGARMQRAADGRYVGKLLLGESGEVVYALRLVGPDGHTFWLNNGRDTGVYRGALWLDYRFRLEALAIAPDTPSRPAFAQLVRALASSASPAGELVTPDDFSLLVEQLTWEGGFGVHESERLLPALRELEALRAEGATFTGGAFEGMLGFVQAQLAIFPRSSYPGLRSVRGADGELSWLLPASGADALTLIFTTDGWNSPAVAPCTRSGDDFTCRIGFAPPGALVAFSPGFRYGTRVEWRHAPGDRNLFQATD